MLLLKVLKAKKETGTNLVEKYGWAIQNSLFPETNQDPTFPYTRENSKMFNITSK